MAKGLLFCIYKYWLMTKELRACIYKPGEQERLAQASGIPLLGCIPGFVDNKWLADLYIQILVDDKGVPRVYIQTGMQVCTFPP
jgi:hypothetical protein